MYILFFQTSYTSIFFPFNFLNLPSMCQTRLLQPPPPGVPQSSRQKVQCHTHTHRPDYYLKKTTVASGQYIAFEPFVTLKSLLAEETTRKKTDLNFLKKRQNKKYTSKVSQRIGRNFVILVSFRTVSPSFVKHFQA